MKEITIPKNLVPLIWAFSANEQSVKLLIIEAARAIYTTQDSFLSEYSVSNEELDEGN
ncbi:MAG: hypothetical protein RSB82_03725 [Victivallaceae bacterium]